MTESSFPFGNLYCEPIITASETIVILANIDQYSYCRETFFTIFAEILFFKYNMTPLYDDCLSDKRNVCIEKYTVHYLRIAPLHNMSFIEADNLGIFFLC